MRHSFFKEFDKVTKESYQIVPNERSKTLDAEPIDIQIGNYYYFQNKKFVR
jgi:hypothetical protein